jgi:hypothetical protein
LHFAKFEPIDCKMQNRNRKLQSANSRDRLHRLVIWSAAWLSVALPGTWAWAEQPQTALIKRLDGATRAKVLAALAGLIILLFAMVALIWLGARITQRYRNRQPYFRPTPRPSEHDWAKRPLSNEPANEGPEE